VLCAVAALAFAPLVGHPAQSPRTLYGPATVRFQVQFPGNPYDPEVTDIRIVFTNERNQKVERIAYFEDGYWKASLMAPNRGRYVAMLVRNGTATGAVGSPGVAQLDQPAPGLVRLSEDRRRLTLNGSSYFPIGMSEARPGLNWMRIAPGEDDLDHPLWPEQDEYPIPDQLSAPAMDAVQERVDAAAEASNRVQFVLFPGAALEAEAWPRHPWNVAKGGFLESPADFFSSAEARRRARAWIRYACARWGGPEIMAWELVGNLPAGELTASQKAVADWTAEMAQFVRTMDGWGRPITASGIPAAHEAWLSLDLLQLEAGETAPADKAVRRFAASPTGENGAPSKTLHASIWRALYRGEAGAPILKGGDELAQELALWHGALSRMPTRPLAAFTVRTDREGVEAEAIGELAWLMVYAEGQPSELRSTGLASGAYTLRVLDLTAGSTVETEAEVRDFTVRLPALPANALLIFERK
jgi:hypothetical protein